MACRDIHAWIRGARPWFAIDQYWSDRADASVDGDVLPIERFDL